MSAELGCSSAEAVCIVVTYRPDKANLAHLESLIDAGQRLIVVDNTEQASPEVRLLGLKYGALYIIHNGNIGGIAGALNRGFDAAADLGERYVVILDQDSELSGGHLQALIRASVAQTELLGRPCIVGPNFFDRGSKTYGRCARLTTFSFKTISVSSPRGEGVLHRTSFLITSGTCMRVEDWRRIGRFNESLFIDHVDTEYCLRAALAGYELFLAEDIVIQHAVGNRSVHKLLGLTFKPSFHSPFRRYFIFRNGLGVMFRFGWRFPGFIVLNTARMAHDFLGILFFEDNRGSKMKAVFRGMRDALIGRLGSYPY